MRRWPGVSTACAIPSARTLIAMLNHTQVSDHSKNSSEVHTSNAPVMGTSTISHSAIEPTL